jgi:hypothetical protein
LRLWRREALAVMASDPSGRPSRTLDDGHSSVVEPVMNELLLALIMTLLILVGVNSK